MADSREPIVVIAAVIEEDGQFLITRRPAGVHLEGFWEFPGGKREPGETDEACLAREIREELGARVEIGAEIHAIAHDYGDRQIQLRFRRCRLRDPARPLIGQEMRWVAAADLPGLPFPPADRELIARLARSRPRSSS